MAEYLRDEPVLPVTLTAFLGDLDMLLAGSPKGDNLLLHRRVRVERVHELDAFWLNRPNGFRATVTKRLGHRRFVGALRATWIKTLNKRFLQLQDSALTVESIVTRLERHLHESIWTEAVLRDKVLAEPFELQHLAVVLTDQVAQPRLGEPDGGAEVARELPLQLLGAGVDLLARLVVLRPWFVLVTLCVRRQARLEESGSGGVDGSGEAHEAFREHV